MAWSTRQLAELAGTTVKAVRYYHEIGLLEVPERRSNGYKQYQVRHLLRLLQIRRLRDLGVPSEQIVEMERPDGDPTAVLRGLDLELQKTIDHLQEVRNDLAVLVKYQVAGTVPPDFSSVEATLSDGNRAAVAIYAQIYGEPAMNDLRRLFEDSSNLPPTELEVQFDDLRSDADPEVILQLAEQIAPILRLDDYPAWRDAAAHTLRGPTVVQSTVAAAMHELYNSAQLEVFRLAHLINTGQAIR